jgi:DeoR family fructose operon transcriptional repressor
VDKAFMGVNGFSFEKGASTPDLQHAEIKKSMVEAASKIFLLFDHSKMGRKAFARFAEINQIDAVIIDEITEDELVLFEDAGIDVFC